MGDGFDLSAYRAAHAEAIKETFPVKLGIAKDDDGTEHAEEIMIPAIREWPIEAQSKIGQGDIVGGIEELVGPEGAELFQKYRWTFGEFEALFEALSKWSGFETGQPSQRLPGLGSIRQSN
jgi:hypothetical protein